MSWSSFHQRLTVHLPIPLPLPLYVLMLVDDSFMRDFNVFSACLHAMICFDVLLQSRNVTIRAKNGSVTTKLTVFRKSRSVMVDSTATTNPTRRSVIVRYAALS